ncbi:MAG: hypothetical protein WDN75_02290 [Bacteroidota bacterium]
MNWHLNPLSIKNIPTALLLLVLVVPFNLSYSQTAPGPSLQYTDVVPDKLLTSRAVVLNNSVFSPPELQTIQKAFQQIGIDAVAYIETDVVLAGKDVTKAYAEYFTARQITYLLFLDKTSTSFQLVGVTFDQTTKLYDTALPAWRVRKEKLNELLVTVFQDSWRGQKKKNFLVNEYPETDITVSPFRGKRQEFYAIDLKIDNLAVPKFGNEAMDKELEEFFQANYPLKYKITEAGVAEQELRRQGFAYVLCYLHTRGKAAKQVLQYDMTKPETAYASITFSSDGQMQPKAIPAETDVYKFYFRHIDNGNVFLGNKWDADIAWIDALRNHVFGFKVEAKIY